MTSRATVALTWACSNRCVFCAQAGAKIRARPDWSARLHDARGGSDEVTFVGGEPTLSEDLEVAVASAADLGFSAIGLQTNASELDLERLKALRDAGLTDLHLSIHGATPDAHDYHVGVPGRLIQCAEVLTTAASLGLTMVATTVVTRSNARVLAELPHWLHRHGIAAWVCRWPVVAGRVGEAFDRTVPRLGLALPYVLHALDRSRKLGLPAAITGAPLCTLGKYAQHHLPDPPRTHPAACTDCDAAPVCPGIDAAYVDRFTDEELRPRPSVAPASAIPPALARMFVDIGPRTEPQVVHHDAPADARRHLQVLGRPAPATAEVRKRSDLRPTEDAQGLFPDLYDDDGKGS